MAKLNTANSCGSISVIIPKNVTKQLGWEAGQEVVIQTQDNKVVLTNVKDIK